MKKVVLFLAVALLAGCSPKGGDSASSQINKERAEITKYSRSQLNEKATKSARQEAKRLLKEGWQVAPGDLPLDRQLDRSYLMQYEYGEDMYPKYIMAEAKSIGENYDAAKRQALALATENLAAQIQTNVAVLVENSVANKQLSAEQAASVTKTISTSKDLIQQNIGRTLPVVAVYRILQNKNNEVLVRLAYNSDMAKNAVKKVVRENLEEECKANGQKLEDVLNW